LAYKARLTRLRIPLPTFPSSESNSRRGDADERFFAYDLVAFGEAADLLFDVFFFALIDKVSFFAMLLSKLRAAFTQAAF
jgi:hypothetical protein